MMAVTFACGSPDEKALCKSDDMNQAQAVAEFETRFGDRIEEMEEVLASESEEGYEILDPDTRFIFGFYEDRPLAETLGRLPGYRLFPVVADHHRGLVFQCAKKEEPEGVSYACFGGQFLGGHGNALTGSWPAIRVEDASGPRARLEYKLQRNGTSEGSWSLDSIKGRANVRTSWQEGDEIFGEVWRGCANEKIHARTDELLERVESSPLFEPASYSTN